MSLFLMDARVDHGKPLGKVFPFIQKSDGSYQTQGKSHMVDAAWDEGGGRNCLRLSSPGFPSGESPVPGVQWYERVQVGHKHSIEIGTRLCYGIGFRVKKGMDEFGQDLASEVVFQSVNERGPTHCIKVVPGAVTYWLSAGETTPSSVSGPAFEVNTGNARVKNLGTQYAVPADRMIYGAYNRVLIDTMLTPDWTGWVDVHHKVDEELGWKEVVTLQDIPTLQCLKDGQRTVPSLSGLAGLINLYLLAEPGYKERDYDFFGLWNDADEAKAEIATFND